MKTLTIDELKILLKSGKVHFEYKKKDGSLREANGTLLMDIIPENKKPKGEEKEYKNLRYFDLDINEWRSIANEISEVTVL